MSTPQRPAPPDDNDDQAAAVELAGPSRQGRTAYRRGAANPNGSTTSLRADAIGVLKVATADQLQRLLRPHATSNKALRQALGDLYLHGLVASDGNTAARYKTWRLEGTAGLDAAGHVLGLPRAEMGSTARGAGASGAPQFALPGGRRKVRPDAVLQAPEIGVPVLMVEVDRSTTAPAWVAAKFAGYRELFRTRAKDNGPALAEEEASERMVHWWRRAYPGHTREGYPPVALVLTGASATTLNNRAAAIGDLAAEFWRGRHHRTRYPDDWWRDYADAVPVLVASLDKLAELGPMGPVWWRYGREGLHCLTDAGAVTLIGE
ncbi:hypothetical protein P3T27_008119 [Kitasatospora sp. MAA19]|uniref:replication-relaxation family protein n=1 Tax=Kitasatospora sp. MAA19 TaxID=3035090 RepID=UPI002474ED1B|nr:replication-relaxation family protein [Kitasatospora sp. MAA19]MDH6711361.1 hypothetical protein [Kitasatospora sp. MAA19]